MTTTPTVPAIADPHASDAELAAQPIGYWSGAAHRAVITHLRDSMARLDVTQPQWWSLNRVLVAGDEGVTRAAVAVQLAEVADGPREVPRALDQLLHRGWIAADAAGALRMTDAGREAHARIKRLVTRLRSEVHEGVPDEEYVTALRVLRRMAANAAAASARAEAEAEAAAGGAEAVAGAEAGGVGVAEAAAGGAEAGGVGGGGRG
ncbi:MULTISPECIES: MarR family winged helix-turn-helix transcriptional regulator [Streptomyces]|uniref:MarR family winged helix-turn-helix transcriptional regulator n=1 Tax=Streptomyces TaxID=1883 RepID=UPI000A826CF0|nr:MarR family winged helix-turn-helix transcriptional regulator [Streptomyces changanensis]